jgi:hypothetical protein
MIKSASPTQIHQLLSPENNLVYEIPPYQREYSWGKEQWDALFDDLLQEDAEAGHFLGTIICVNNTKDAVSKTVLELVDGQQRMTTISLYLLAIYKRLKLVEDYLDDEDRSHLVTLRKMLCLKDPSRQRLLLQKQNSNADDYAALLYEAGFDLEKPKITYLGVRRISKALVHFQKRIADHLPADPASQAKGLLELFGRIKRAILVKLEVESYSDAFVLFESLNNRGLPLTPIDLIKTSLLSIADKRKDMSVDDVYSSWSAWLEALGDEYSSQERFFRQFYNAFKADWNLAVTGAPIAYRSKLIKIYDELLRGDLDVFISRMDVATRAYGRLLGNVSDERSPSQFDKAVVNLTRAQGAPSFMLLLFLLVNQEKLNVSDSDLTTIAGQLTKFFVRRNLTNTPPTYDLDRIFMSIVELLPSNAGQVRTIVLDQLRAHSASDELFKAQLGGPIYDDNSAVTRFVLTALAEQGMTNEMHRDLWTKQKAGDNKDIYVWTIEHILPQGENLPSEWITMLGGSENASKTQRALVHTIGNLTITGYNSTLGNRSFIDKRDRRDANGNFVGYRNGLSINDALVNREAWTASDIESRTKELVDLANLMFSLDF